MKDVADTPEAAAFVQTTRGEPATTYAQNY